MTSFYLLYVQKKLLLHYCVGSGSGGGHGGLKVVNFKASNRRILHCEVITCTIKGVVSPCLRKKKYGGLLTQKLLAASNGVG